MTGPRPAPPRPNRIGRDRASVTDCIKIGELLDWPARNRRTP